MALSDLNLDGVPMEAARKKIDPHMRALVDQIDDAYYGTPQEDGTRAQDGWKHGVSHPFLVWDREDTAERSRIKFELISGIIHAYTALAQHFVNMSEPDDRQFPVSRYNETRAQDGSIAYKDRQERETIRDLIEQYNAQQLTPPMEDLKVIREYINKASSIAEIMRSRPLLSSILDV